MKPTTFATDRRWQTGMLFTLAIVLIYLVRRSLGLNPAVFADEWYYSEFARLKPLAESILPSYLYLWIMRATNTCGTGFLDCARILNVLFFVGSAPFVYLTARAFTTVRLAVWVTIVCTLMPIGSFTAYFMPESIYYFGFCVLAWYALAKCQGNRYFFALITGAILGVMSLIKVHALFLLPALCIYIFYLDASDKTRKASYIRAALLAAIAFTATIATKLGLGYLLAGKTGLNVFGSFYSSTATGAKPSSIVDLLKMVSMSGQGHAMALALLFAFPLAIVGQTLLSQMTGHGVDASKNKLHLFTFLMLGSAVGVTVLYTASITKIVPQEILRLHMRYYDFAFPLLLIIAANALTQPRPTSMPKATWLLVAGLGITILIATIKLPLYTLGHVDAPDIISIVEDHWLLYISAILGIIILVLLAKNNMLGAVLFLFVLMPGSLTVAELQLSKHMQSLVAESGFDAAGKFIRERIPSDERGGITVLGSGVGQLMRVLFYIDNKDADFIDIPYGSAISRDQLPITKKWALVIQPHPLPSGVDIAAQTSQFTLLRLDSDLPHTAPTAMMNGPFPSGPVASVEGLSEQEPMGRWSNGKQVILHMAQPLPKKLVLLLHAAAFGPNVNQPFLITVGSTTKQLRLGATPADVALPFDTDGGVTTVNIAVPQPTSPLSLKQSDDPRLLGIMLGRVTVKTAE